MGIFEEMDDAVACIEIVFENGELQYEREYVGNVVELTELLTSEYLDERRINAKAENAYVQNIYFSGSNVSGWRSEFRMGNQPGIDIEINVMRGGA